MKDQMKPWMNCLEEKINVLRWLADVFQQADAAKTRSDHQQVAALSNFLAEKALGWKQDPDDQERLWRHLDGTPVVYESSAGESFKICYHPWRDQYNDDQTLSFSPGHNYHARWLDWRIFVINAALNTHDLPVKYRSMDEHKASISKDLAELRYIDAPAWRTRPSSHRIALLVNVVVAFLSRDISWRSALHALKYPDETKALSLRSRRGMLLVCPCLIEEMFDMVRPSQKNGATHERP